MGEPGLNPFRVTKYFQEHVSQVLQSLDTDPAGMYQIVYRVGDLVVSAQLWRDSGEQKFDLTELDKAFLERIQVTMEDDPSDAVI